MAKTDKELKQFNTYPRPNSTVRPDRLSLEILDEWTRAVEPPKTRASIDLHRRLLKTFIRRLRS